MPFLVSTLLFEVDSMSAINGFLKSFTIGFIIYHMLLCFLINFFAIKMVNTYLGVFFQAVYGTLFEAEHRSTFYIPYWKFPLAKWLVPRQRKFQKDLKFINDCLDDLIRNAKETRQVRSI